jgi:hypothetical protein
VHRASLSKNKNVDISNLVPIMCFGITSTKYTDDQKIGKPNDLNVLGSKEN